MSNKIRNIDFKTFIINYIPNIYESYSKDYTPEPIEINFAYGDEDEYNHTKFLFAIDWHTRNLQDLEKILSKEVFNSYVEKFWLDQDNNRICLTLTKCKYRD
jgi:hypothetical protein